MLVYLLAPVAVTQQEITSVANFTKKQNVLTGGSAIFGEAKSTDSKDMELKGGHPFVLAAPLSRRVEGPLSVYRSAPHLLFLSN